MAKFKIITSDPTTGKSQATELEGSRAAPLIGRKIGEAIDGSVVGLSGKKLQITGGSDKDGFPMRTDIHGGVRAKVIVSQGSGFQPTQKGERKRKTLRGNIITEEIVQINMKIAEKPKKPEKAEKVEPKEKIEEEKPKEIEKPKEEKKERKRRKEKPKEDIKEKTEETAQTA